MNLSLFFGVKRRGRNFCSRPVRKNAFHHSYWRVHHHRICLSPIYLATEIDPFCETLWVKLHWEHGQCPKYQLHLSQCTIVRILESRDFLFTVLLHFVISTDLVSLCVVFWDVMLFVFWIAIISLCSVVEAAHSPETRITTFLTAQCHYPETPKKSSSLNL